MMMHRKCLQGLRRNDLLLIKGYWDGHKITKAFNLAAIEFLCQSKSRSLLYVCVALVCVLHMLTTCHIHVFII